MWKLIINECKYTHTHWLNVHLQPLQKPYARACTQSTVHVKDVHIYLGLFLSHSSSVSKIGISVMSSAAGDNKLVEEPITSRWQAGGSGFSTCHYLHIDISRSPDRPFLWLPWQVTMINLGKRGGGGSEIHRHAYADTVHKKRFYWIQIFLLLILEHTLI